MNNKKSNRLYIYHTFLSRRKDLGQFNKIKDLTNQLDYIESMGFNAILTKVVSFGTLYCLLSMLQAVLNDLKHLLDS